MSKNERQYLDLVNSILLYGERKDDWMGTGTLSIFGAQLRFDLREGFPLLTTKKVNFSAVVRELFWFLSGSTNVNDELTEHTSIWDARANEHGELGPVYGHSWLNHREGLRQQLERQPYDLPTVKVAANPSMTSCSKTSPSLDTGIILEFGSRWRCSGRISHRGTPARYAELGHDVVPTLR